MLPIDQLAELACREGQATSPLFRVHRWFARRLSSQFRAILTGLSLPAGAREDDFWSRFLGEIDLRDAVVLDPFVGGGTSVVEATRCGARVIGYDIDPVATTITRFELAAANYGDIPQEVLDLIQSVANVISPFHRTKLKDGITATVLHHFWVEVQECRNCGLEIELHPHYRLAYDNTAGIQWVFCRHCHAVKEVPLSRQAFVCEACHRRTRIEATPLSKGGRVTCPGCEESWKLADGYRQGESPRWRLFAQEYLTAEPSARQPHRHFKSATATDVALYNEAAALLAANEANLGAFVPERPIPAEGRADRRPLIYGFSRYRDLFNDRQLLHLTLLGRTIARVEDYGLRHLLSLAFSDHLTTNCMYTGYAFGYRRTSPLFSIHAYRHITRPVELNPWLHGIGRGTFPNAFDKVRRAIEFAKNPSDLAPKGGRRAAAGRIGVDTEIGTAPGDVLSERCRAAIITASAINLVQLPSETVDLVLTDPPYFNNISYSELSDFYLAWHQVLGVAPAPYDNPEIPAPIVENLALTSRTEEAVNRYTNELAAILKECARVLRSDGICVFTYHHVSPDAWIALAYALALSGLRVTAVLPLRGEGNGGLHSFDGTIKWDAVLVCRKGSPGRAAGRDLYVQKEDVREARRLTRLYAGRLAGRRSIGFREPDQLNLFRAMIAARARFGEPGGETIAIAHAMSLTPFRK